MSGRRATPRRSRRGAQANSSEAPAAAAPAPASAPAAAAAAAASNNNDDDDVAEVSSGGGTTSSGSGSGGGSSGDGGGGGGGGSAGEDDGNADSVEMVKRVRNRDGGSSSAVKQTKSVHANKESSDRWFSNTHIAMVSILAALFNDLEERHSTTYGKDPAVDNAVVSYIQRIKDIGQGVTVYTMSNLQTHSLISNTVQLCHRMAADQHSRLAKDYPTEEQVEYGVYDLSTDDERGMLDDDDDDDGDFCDTAKPAATRGKKRALASSAKAEASRGGVKKGGGGVGCSAIRGAWGDADGEDQATPRPSAGKKPRRAAAAAAAAAIAATSSAGGGEASAAAAAGAGGGGAGDEDGDGDVDGEEVSSGKRKKGKGKQGASSSVRRSVGSSGASGNGVADGGGGGAGAGAGASSAGAAAAKKEEDVKLMGPKAKGKGEEESAVAGFLIRERFHAVVVKLVARAKWASEAVGRPHKDVITRAREVTMAIFIDSFYRRMLSLHKLDKALTQLDRMIAWADAAEDDTNANDAGALGEGLPLGLIGLTNIALTMPE
eukprot:g5706.t1